MTARGFTMKKLVLPAASMPPKREMEMVHEFTRGLYRGGKIYKDSEGKFWLAHGIMSHQVPNALVRNVTRKKGKIKEEPLADGISKQ